MLNTRLINITCIALLFASNSAFGRTTDVTLPSYLIQRTYTTEEAIALKNYDINFRTHLKVETATKEAMTDAAQKQNKPELKELGERRYNEFLVTYKLQLENECWNRYVFSKNKGSYSDICYLLKMPAVAAFNNSNWKGARNRYFAEEKLSISEQRSLAETRKSAERTTSFEIARDRRAEQETDSKDAEYAKHPY